MYNSSMLWELTHPHMVKDAGLRVLLVQKFFFTTSPLLRPLICSAQLFSHHTWDLEQTARLSLLLTPTVRRPPMTSLKVSRTQTINLGTQTIHAIYQKARGSRWSHHLIWAVYQLRHQVNRFWICDIKHGEEQSRNVWTKLMFCLQTSVPPLPPRPSFMQSMPEYLILLPSSPSSSSSSQKSRSEPKPAASPTSKGNLFCCQNKN